MTEDDEIEIEVHDSDKRLSMVDEALVAGTIANTNGLLVILAKLVAKGVFDRSDLQSFSDSYSKPLDRVTTETMILRRDRSGWKIVHIHWSSGAAP